MSNKIVQSKSAITKSVEKLPISKKTARKVAIKIQSVQKNTVKTIRNASGTMVEIGTGALIDAKQNSDEKKKQ